MSKILEADLMDKAEVEKMIYDHKSSDNWTYVDRESIMKVLLKMHDRLERITALRIRQVGIIDRLREQVLIEVEKHTDVSQKLADCAGSGDAALLEKVRGLESELSHATGAMQILNTALAHRNSIYNDAKRLLDQVRVELTDAKIELSRKEGELERAIAVSEKLRTESGAAEEIAFHKLTVTTLLEKNLALSKELAEEKHQKRFRQVSVKALRDQIDDAMNMLEGILAIGEDAEVAEADANNKAFRQDTHRGEPVSTEKPTPCDAVRVSEAWAHAGVVMEGKYYSRRKLTPEEFDEFGIERLLYRAGDYVYELKKVPVEKWVAPDLNVPDESVQAPTNVSDLLDERED